MTLTKEDLLAISQVFGEQIKPLKEAVTRLEGRMTALEERMTALEERMTRLEERVTALEERVTRLETKVERLEFRVSVLEGKVEGLEVRAVSLEEKAQRIELFMENDMLPRLQNIEACYTSTYKRYVQGSDQIETMQADIDVLKKVVQEHSEKLKRLA